MAQYVGRREKLRCVTKILTTSTKGSSRARRLYSRVPPRRISLPLKEMYRCAVPFSGAGNRRLRSSRPGGGGVLDTETNKSLCYAMMALTLKMQTVLICVLIFEENFLQSVPDSVSRPGLRPKLVGPQGGDGVVPVNVLLRAPANENRKTVLQGGRGSEERGGGGGGGE